ncbi:hypothetical protein KCP78_14040 [Salmonella enterica subsp. enterica]|nr:hypothetical protein KCP78_14040 [Salmonella enterica subsp. enterica]
MRAFTEAVQKVSPGKQQLCQPCLCPRGRWPKRQLHQPRSLAAAFYEPTNPVQTKCCVKRNTALRENI